MKPVRLFHYQPFVEAHLVSLLSAGQLKLSRPEPGGPRPNPDVPTDPEDRKRVLAYLVEVQRKHDPSKSEAERRRVATDFMANPSKLEAAFVQMEKQIYADLCRQYRIYCLTEDPVSPLMWGHYAASHTGICLEFDARREPFPATEKVQYCTTYPAHDLPTIGYKPLITKSFDWSYEVEWRLIVEERAAPIISPFTLKTNNDLLTLPSGVLKSVTIGALADETSRLLIEDLVKTHAIGVLVRQATVARDRYELEIKPPF